MRFSKELLSGGTGKTVRNQADWENRRLEILDVLSKYAYGYIPRDSIHTEMEVVESDEKCASGHAVLNKVVFRMTSELGTHTFPGNFFLPCKSGKLPLILMLNFRPDAYDMYFPAEEIIDHGFAILSVCYDDISRDEPNMDDDGLAAIVSRPENPEFGFGKLSIWALAASRMMDVLCTLPYIDPERIAVAGHSRLGKTALWCGANDRRFKYVLSNCAGCMGDALHQIKHEGSETIKSIAHVFPYWFSSAFQSFASEDELPYDQHWLIACIAPNYVCLGSAERDLWADPVSQQLSCVGASPAWSFYGLPGFSGPENPLDVNSVSTEGHIEIHYRDGVHFFGRPDWLHYLDFMERHPK